MADTAKNAEYAATLLDTISAFGDDAPPFERDGVEIFDCSEVEDGPEMAEAKVGTTRRMKVQIGDETFVVIAYCASV